MTYPTVHPCIICDAVTIETRTPTDDGIVIVSFRCGCGHIEVRRLTFSQAEALPPAVASRPMQDDEEQSGARRL